MKRLGYTRYVAQGGDWGNAVTEQMALQEAPELIGIHTNMPATVPAEIDRQRFAGAPAPPGLSADEKHAYEQLDFFYKHGLGYAKEMANRPQTLYGLRIRPSGWPPGCSTTTPQSHGDDRARLRRTVRGLTRDDVLDNITLYWLTNTAISSARLYWESKLAFFAPKERQHPGGRERLSGRALSSPAELGGEGLSQADPLQQAGQGRPLRGLGTAGDLFSGSARGVSAPAVTRPRQSARGSAGARGLEPSTTRSRTGIRRRRMGLTDSA